MLHTDNIGIGGIPFIHNFYVNRIRQGKITIDDVPEKWREEVRKKLENID